MKNTLSLFILLASLYSFGQTQTQKALLYKKADMYCVASGTWGWTAQDLIKSQNDSKAVIFQMYPLTSNQLYCLAAKDIDANFGSTNITPEWRVNGIDNTVYVSGLTDVNATEANIQNNVNLTYATPAIVNSAYSMSITQLSPTFYKIDVNTNTRFFSNATGDFYIGAYIIQGSATAVQDGIGTAAVHTDILMGSMDSTSSFGKLLVSGSVAANTLINTSFSINRNTAGTLTFTNLSMVLVIWKKVGTTYQYVNASKEQISLTTDEFAEASNFNFYPNPAKDMVHMDNKNDEEVIVTVYNVNGQECMSPIHFTNEDNLDVSNLSPGFYFINTKQGNESKNYKLIKN